jgi:hypothetical protein
MVDQWAAPPAPQKASSSSPLDGGMLKTAHFCVSHGLGVDGRAGAKSPLRANDGDACGSRHLLGGVMALPELPHLEHRGKP